MAISRRLVRAVATDYLAQASGVTASAITDLAADRNAAMSGAASGRALVGSSAGGQSASFQLDMKPTERVVLFQSAIDFLGGISVSRTNADFSSILDS
jgi:cytolysin (calcineurin-like family phosphatase)